MKTSPDPDPLRVLVSMDGSLESETFASRLNATPGFAGLIDEIEQAEVCLSDECGRSLPVPTLVLTKWGRAAYDAAGCGCCQPISRDTSWQLLLDALIAAADRDPRPTTQLSLSGPPNELGTLTRRELDVLQLVGHGKSIAECAEALGVAPSTIGNHKYRLMRKLDVNNSLQLMRIAVRHGLADIEEQG
ncbi:MAG: LuxR C-terminal-related transcriptional regulator [Planctomycetota bacterium]